MKCKYCGADLLSCFENAGKWECGSFGSLTIGPGYQSPRCKDRQIAWLSKRIEELTSVGDALLAAKTVEAKLRLYIVRLKAAGDDYGRDEDGKWWSKVRNEQP